VLGPKGKKLRKLFWANEATLVTMGRPPGALPLYPNLVLAACLTRPGEDPGGTAVRLLASVRVRGYPAGLLGADLGPGAMGQPVEADVSDPKTLGLL
jgi:hypothetical protein